MPNFIPMMRSARPMLKNIATKLRNRFGYALLIIFAIIIGVWFFFSDLKIQLFDLPILAARRQTAVKIISAFTANDLVIDEGHNPIRKAPYCFWGNDSWTYTSERTWSEIKSAFDSSFVSWEKWTGGLYATYHDGPIFVSIRESGINTYIVELSVYDPITPHCGPD